MGVAAEALSNVLAEVKGELLRRVKERRLKKKAPAEEPKPASGPSQDDEEEA